jgi:signal transduction histidine kinase/DNA-binding response OmpR family regulator
MARLEDESPAWVVPAISGLVVAVFVTDLFTPRGYAPWVLYLVPMTLCLAARRPTVPLVTASVITPLLIVGLLLSPTSPAAAIAPLNRVFGLLAMWILGGVGRELIRSRNDLHRQGWLERGHAALVEQVRGGQSIRDLGEGALACLGPYIGAQVGVFYERDGDTLTRIAGWGFEPSEGHPQVIEVGKGLIGQVAHDGHARVVRELADDGLRVRSGLLDTRLRQAVLAPSSADGEVNGVLEFGSLQPVDELDRELLERASEAIGMALRSARYRENLQALLEETQRQAERLQEQQEELSSSNEELERQTRQLTEAHARLESQQAELEQINAHLEEQATELEGQKQQLIESRHAIETTAVELDRAHRLKSEFLANMSHELRTPLNSTLILARLLAENKAGNLDADQVRFAETIYSAGNDLLALIDDILDLSKIEAGRIDVQFTDVRLHRLVDALHDTFEPLAAQRKLEFRVEIDPEVPDTIQSDTQRLKQILRNLLSNAFKFTERGEVNLVIRAGGHGAIEFAVHDTGIGIPESEHETVFEAFRQADGTTSRLFGGTGLGLSISRRLAELLGGRIELTSAPGAGSCFRLVLPVSSHATLRPASIRSRPSPIRPVQTRPQPKQATASAPRPSRERSDRLILVVEDDPSFSSILRDLVQEQGFECIVAATAGEGLALVRELLPAAVLLDVELPDASGLYVLGQLKSELETRHVPVHMMSVHDQSEIALALGAIGYAIKPVRREQILEAIQKLQHKLSQQSKRLLLVEDDARLRADLDELLRADGLEIVGVDTVTAALEQLEQLTFDCVVLDLQLPDGSGRLLLEQMAASERYAFPPVIVYTGHDVGAEEEQLLRRYSQSIIIKGARSPERLLDEVTLFLHQVEAKLPPERQRMLREVRQRDSAFEGRRLLLAEDDVRNIFALSSVFEPRGAKLCIARNGKEALEILASEQKIDLVLMDIMMPEMDGLTAIREIRKQARYQQLPIIAITAKATRDDHRQCLAAGASDYLAKPIDIDKLLSLCRVWMR